MDSLRKEGFSMDGIVTVLNTPFTDDDRIDTASLERNVQRACTAGVTGFLVPAMAGEVFSLSAEERRLLMNTTVEAAAGRAPVIGGAYGTDHRERLREAERVMEAGCGGLLIYIPYTDRRSFLRQVREAAALEPGFLMLQDWDSSGYGIPLEIIGEAMEAEPVFKWLKIEVVPAGTKYTAVRSMAGSRLGVAGGWAVTQMIEGLDRGVDLFMPTGMHELYTRIYRLYRSGDRAGAVELFHALLPILAFSNQHLDISIHFFKRLLWREGTYAAPYTRQLGVEFDGYHVRIADELIEHAIRLSEGLH
jgi:4-hydroxy-tetrahydrodipicolinate synthase